MVRLVLGLAAGIVLRSLLRLTLTLALVSTLTAFLLPSLPGFPSGGRLGVQDQVAMVQKAFRDIERHLR